MLSKKESSIDVWFIEKLSAGTRRLLQRRLMVKIWSQMPELNLESKEKTTVTKEISKEKEINKEKEMKI